MESYSGFNYGNAEEAQLSEEKLAEMNQKLEQEEAKTCIVYRNGRIIHEYYKHASLRNELQIVNSVTKSVLSLVTGIAADKGFIASTETLLSEYFPELSDDMDGKGNITLKQVLTMTTGIDLPGNKEMLQSEDWLKFIWSRSLRNEPGTKMHYSSADSHILSAVIRKAAGKDASEIAEEYLFSPLGIKDFQWKRDPAGLPVGGWGLKLRSIDMLKIGILALNHGKWKERKLVSERWMGDAVKPHAPSKAPGQHYGYHWWISKSPGGNLPSFFYAAGRGGQYIFIVPEYDLITVFTGNYSGEKESIRPYQLFIQHILRTVKE
ncbi:beta-lactamase family protein [Evansella sp. LMS18]|jgi:CubicO group peptidase (beta-lactamase class C family)|uniref:serine hydrolase domain-containing protein n=1 Tax=Evansella sp. LMS18 TaxID=2924033 RepID=UPI0020D16F31|nr:serine hydrolase [Evansella sp. LMS18]UTR09748.1 beta-lactamase family protein [Evansella sp. LMS18]